MKRADGGWASFHIRGYGLTLSAADLIKIITRAFAENPTSSNSSSGCLLDVTDGGVNFTTVFVRRAKGIRTFFPDATPDVGGTQPCAAPIVLPGGGMAPITPGCDDDGDSQILKAGRFRISVTSVDENGFNLRVTECE